jgi:hypothetical protein
MATDVMSYKQAVKRVDEDVELHKAQELTAAVDRIEDLKGRQERLITSLKRAISKIEKTLAVVEPAAEALRALDLTPEEWYRYGHGQHKFGSPNDAGITHMSPGSAELPDLLASTAEALRKRATLMRAEIKQCQVKLAELDRQLAELKK